MVQASTQLQQDLLSFLRQQAKPLRSAQLQAQFLISQPTASRALAALVAGGYVVKLGQGRNQHYAVPRHVPDVGSRIPVTAVTPEGHVQAWGSLPALHGGGFWVEGDGSRAMLGAGRYFDGLPWLIQDMRPQGFLGRRFARQHLPHRLSSDPRQWSDDDALLAITQFGDDLPGNLIVGEAALQRYVQRSSKSLPVAERRATTCCPCASCPCRAKCPHGRGTWTPCNLQPRCCLCGKKRGHWRSGFGDRWHRCSFNR